jgi:cell division initiation protein
MPIRPIDLRRKEFKSGFRGYDANQVDDFLDEVADEFERAVADNGRMRDEIEVLKGRLEQFEQLESSIQAALVHAERAAEDLRRTARREADQMRAAAQQEADFTIREAQERSHRMLADSSSRVERVQASYEALTKAKQEFANDFRHLMKTYLAVMDQAETATAREIEASLRDRMDTESIAVARRASETRDLGGEAGGTDAGISDDGDDVTRVYRREGSEFVSEPPGESGPLGHADEEDVSAQATERIEMPAGGESPSAGAAPEIEEPEPSSVDRASEEETVPDNEGSGAADEADREEGMPAGGDRNADEFFGDESRREGQAGGEEERKLFRASRFLRRRG